MIARFPACHSVLLNYSVEPLNFRRGFSLRYRMGDYELFDCGETLFTNSSGFISLLRNPTNYPATVNCTYTISANQSYYIFLNISLSPSWMPLFQSFQDCSKEWLMVGCLSDGGTELNRSTTRIFCHQKEPSNIKPLAFADCRTLKLSIRSYTYDYRETFRIPFSVIGPDSICGDTSFSNSTGVISSPQLPFQYSKLFNCLYTIEYGSVNSVVLSLDQLFLSYYITDHWPKQCGNRFLTITCLVNGTVMDQPLSFNGKICGFRRYPTTGRFPACNSVLLNLTSNFVSLDRLFIIRYRWGDYELDCGTTLFANTSGVINFPWNPTAYPATINCTYTISAKGRSHILFSPYFSSTTQQLLIRSFQECDGEGITLGCLSEGETELNPNTTRQFCGNVGSTEYYGIDRQFVFTDCRTVKLSIRSSAYDNRARISIPFKVLGLDEICGNTSFSAPYGVLSSPQVPLGFPRAVNCVYVIDSGHENSVVLYVDRLYLGSMDDVRSGTCNNDWLTITCLVNETSMAHSIADRKLCNIHSPVVVRFPACRSVFFNFSISYTAKTDAGFTVRYRMGDYDRQCGNTIFSGPNGVINSPSFPLSSPHNLNCLYSITGGKWSIISLDFISFRIDGSSNPDPHTAWCSNAWLTVSCLSDRSVVANISSSRKYCGYKTTPLKFEFPNCEAVVLNFKSSMHSNKGVFKVNYTVRDTDFICGVPVYGPPSGMISFPLNSTKYDNLFDCQYVVNATKPSSISLTIWSINPRSSGESNCQRDWLLIKSADDDQTSWKLNITHRSCDHLDYSVQFTFPGCVAIEIDFHRESVAAGKTFRIDYTVASYDENVSTTELTSTSILDADRVGTNKSCATGCGLNYDDSTSCDCLPDARQTAAMSVSTAIPVTANCEVGCAISKDGSNCDCSTTQSGDHVVNTQMGLSGKREHATGISLAVIFVVIGVICLGAFLLFRRHQKKKRLEMILHASEEERAQRELNAESTKSESSCGADRNQDQDTSKYLPLRPISQVGHQEPSPSITDSTKNLSEIQLGP